MADDRDENPYAPPPADDREWMSIHEDRVYVRGFLHGGLGGFLLCVEVIAFICWLLGK